MNTISIQLSDFVDSMPVAVVVIDSTSQIVMFNAEAERIFGYSTAEIVGQPVTRLFPARFGDEHGSHIKAFFKSPNHRLLGEGSELVGLRADGTEFPAEVALGFIRLSGGMLATSVVADLTDRQRANKERLQLTAERKEAVSDIKKLSGLLPICADCKKIRDDRGYWKQIEAYIAEHSEADFSHGICPECFEAQYPDIGED